MLSCDFNKVASDFSRLSCNNKAIVDGGSNQSLSPVKLLQKNL